MATGNVKHEALQANSGPVKMSSPSEEGLGKGSSGEQSFSAMQGLILAEDRRTKEKDMNNFQNVSFSCFVNLIFFNVVSPFEPCCLKRPAECFFVGGCTITMYFCVSFTYAC